jgi:hypothetical protein
MPFTAKSKLQGAFVNDCRTSTNLQLVEKWIYRDVPYAFRTRKEQYRDWCAALADCLGLSVETIVVVGSTAAGLSFSPDKRLRSHSPQSDIDVGVVAQNIFREAWDWFLQQRVERIAYPPPVHGWIDDHRTRLIFFRQIGCDQYLEYLPFGKKWNICLEAASKRSPADERPVKARIYEDKVALTSYLTHGVTTLRRNLNI